MTRTTRSFAALLGLAAWALGAPAMAAPTLAANVNMLTGIATATAPDGNVRRLSKADAVNAGDLLNTGPGSYLNLRFVDGGFVLLKPNSRFAVEDFAAPDVAVTTPAPAAAATPTAPSAAAPPPLVAASPQAATGSSRAFFRLFKGGFRAVTGAIGRINRNDYRVATPVATIGIRGTKFGGDLCEGSCSDREDITSQLQGAGTDTDGTEMVLVTTVEEGEISITSSTSTQTQTPGEVLFTLDQGTITPGTRTPPSIRNDEGIEPETCGG
jgi:hypothetical protein